MNVVTITKQPFVPFATYEEYMIHQAYAASRELYSLACNGVDINEQDIANTIILLREVQFLLRSKR